MSQTAEHYLGIYSTRLEMQVGGITSPSPTVKKFTKQLVSGLEALELKTKIKSVQALGKIDFVVVDTGEVIATLSE